MRHKPVTLEQVFEAIPERDRLEIVKGAARFFPPVEDGDDERAFPVDKTVELTTLKAYDRPE